MENSRARMAASWRVVADPTLQGLGVECSDMPIGASDLDLLIMRRDRLNEHIERSYDYLCESLTSSGIGRGGARRSALSPSSLMIGAQTRAQSPSSLMIGAQARAQKMMAKGRGAVLKQNLVTTNPGVMSKPEYKCYKCGQGHRSKDCPYWPKDPTVCWRCHRTGHFYRNCKNVVDTATQTPQKMPQFCRKERELRQPSVVESQREEETYVRMGREEGGQTAVVRRVSFNEKTEECEGGQILEVSPEKCSTPSDADSRKHTPIMFADNPESPSVSPLRADISTPEVGNSPQLPVKSPGSLFFK